MGSPAAPAYLKSCGNSAVDRQRPGTASQAEIVDGDRRAGTTPSGSLRARPMDRPTRSLRTRRSCARWDATDDRNARDASVCRPSPELLVPEEGGLGAPAARSIAVLYTCRARHRRWRAWRSVLLILCPRGSTVPLGIPSTSRHVPPCRCSRRDESIIPVVAPDTPAAGKEAIALVGMATPAGGSVSATLTRTPFTRIPRSCSLT
jgi:hypothetical protein